jgi:hypothetical protein
VAKKYLNLLLISTNPWKSALIRGCLFCKTKPIFAFFSLKTRIPMKNKANSKPKFILHSLDEGGQTQFKPNFGRRAKTGLTLQGDVQFGCYNPIGVFRELAFEYSG